MNLSTQMTMKEQIASSALKVAPPLTVSGLTVMGLNLQDWVYIGTLIYLGFQIFVIIRDKMIREWSSRKDKKGRQK